MVGNLKVMHVFQLSISVHSFNLQVMSMLDC